MASTAPKISANILTVDADASRDAPARPRAKATIVVPCYNEEETLPYLAGVLQSLEAKTRTEFEFSFVLVDDGSSDGTWAAMHAVFGARSNYTLVRHPRNRGIAAATLTGIRRARDEVVCGIDADCSFDPHALAQMIPLLDANVDMVQASPYHRDGGVLNVPRWRLGLSKTASRLYRPLLRHKFASYTACFRVYRRSAVENLRLDDEGFLGIAEIFVRLDQSGANIVEYPAVLATRVTGVSKMRTLSVIFAHLGMLRRLLLGKLGLARSDARASAARTVKSGAR